MSTVAIAKLDEYKAMLKSRQDYSKRMQDACQLEMIIDSTTLDDESLRTPVLHGKWNATLCEESASLRNLQSAQKRVYLDRWKYYQGKQTDRYYVEYGNQPERVLKTDLDAYLDADPFVAVFKEIIETQHQLVIFLERAIKEISARTFHIKSAIEWRKFTSGVV